ncbi:hypothetical protein HacjB3_05645 [Halalkalicoccus jeotgali B3]|uniref:Uncharacterized protein n=1 Tax=Halalkalicoccus jeotgali (strain DSM 18796 / CECT 7217 / JCM 14584 / KCTC 4019 / B3) TaxID=795797 RepID=D8J9Z8_HALJB|nr:hypothetical protein HacjB3_05645 [Halalkalicoccus jeotgali B3]
MVFVIPIPLGVIRRNLASDLLVAQFDIVVVAIAVAAMDHE